MFPGLEMNRTFTWQQQNVCSGWYPLKLELLERRLFEHFFSPFFSRSFWLHHLKNTELGISGGTGKQESEQNKVPKKLKVLQFPKHTKTRFPAILYLLVCKFRYAITVCALISYFCEIASDKLSLKCFL